MNEVVNISTLVGTLLIIVSGLAFMFSFNRSKRTAGTLFFFGVIAVALGAILPSLSPAKYASVWSFFEAIPLWVKVIVGGLIIISVLQGFVSMFLGRPAADSFAGNLTASLFRGVIVVLLAPFRLLSRFFGN